MNVRKLGWVGLLAVAVMSGFVLRGTDLRRADAADQPGENKIVVISSNSALFALFITASSSSS